VELPFNNDSFDVVLCSVSVDYLTRPMGVFKEVHQVLKPSGTCAMRYPIDNTPGVLTLAALSLWGEQV
jgi:ubiquinone/menaquinone biosynthesis C-methylase UbiE